MLIKKIDPMYFNSFQQLIKQCIRSVVLNVITFSRFLAQEIKAYLLIFIEKKLIQLENKNVPKSLNKSK